jgi:Flp pilus assembly CpaE family ATPase
MDSPDFKVLHVEDDRVNALIVGKMLETSESPTFEVLHADSLLKALDLLTQTRVDAAIVDLNLPDSSGIETFLTIQRNAPSLAVVVLSGDENQSLARKAVELGAQDYLAKTDLKKNDLVRAVQYAIIRSRKVATEERSRSGPSGVIGLVGAKGGVGVTTLACHFARELKRETGDAVLLSGFDSGAAGVSYLMKAQCQYTVADAAQNLHRLDVDLWRGYVHTTPDGVDVLCPPGAGGALAPLETDRISHIVRFARALYSWMVLDLGVVNLFALAMLDQVDHIYMITSDDLPSLWETGRHLKRLREAGLNADRLRLVVNQKKRRDGVPTEDLEKALGYSIEATVTGAWEEQTDLFAGGRFVDEKSQIRKDTTPIIAKLLGKEPDKSRTTFGFKRLLRR